MIDPPHGPKPTTEPCSSHIPALVTAKSASRSRLLSVIPSAVNCADVSRFSSVAVRTRNVSEMSLIAIGRIVRMESNVKDETRAGERADDLNLGKMRSGAGPCELRSIPARCLCRLVRLIHSFA